MYEIYHETNFQNFKNIIKEFKLYKSSYNKKFEKGQGSKNRRLSNDPFVSLNDNCFFEKYDEVDAVYFRLNKLNQPILKYNDVLLLFGKNVLEIYPNVINTTENFGFMINENGIEKESQFSGELGISIYNLQNVEILDNYNFNYIDSEIAILDNVDLRYCKKIFIRKKYKNMLDNINSDIEIILK